MELISTQFTRSSQVLEAPFTYIITRNKTDKVHWSQHTKPFDRFVQTFVSRGHPVGEKDGSGIVAAEFAPDTRLEDKNVLRVTAVILDVDGKVRENGIETVTHIDPDEFLAKLPFRGIAHTSFNHSAELAKFRVILPLAQPLTKDDFLRVWWWAFEKSGRTCDPSCKNPSRMFYLPRRHPDAAEGIHWVRELHGPLLSLADVPASFKPSGPGAPASPKVKTGLHVSNGSTRYQTVDPHLVLDELVALPVYEWALEFPNDVSREAWRGLATNLAALVVEEHDMYEPCSQAFHNLSMVDLSRYDYGTCERTFRDAVNSARNVGPMTWNTLQMAGAPGDACTGHLERSPVAVARAHVVRRVRQQAQAQAVDRSNKPRPSKPLPDGHSFIQELPSGVTPASAPSLEAPVAAQAASEPPAPPPEAPPKPPEDPADPNAPALWFDETNFVFDGSTGEWLQWDTTGRLAARLSDMSFTRNLLANGHERKAAEVFKAMIPHVSARKAFYDRPDRIVEVNGVKYLNTYEPSTILPIPGNWDPIYQLIVNVCGGDLVGTEFVLDWIAAPLQSLQHGKPWKTLTALVFQGAQGSGKGTLAYILRQIYGKGNTVELTQEALDNRFNEMLEDKLLVVANEVISSNNRSLETSNKLKTWVTDPFINLEKKYEGRKEVENNFNIMFLSNDPRPVIVEETDRRFVVFESHALPQTISSVIWDDLKGDQKMIAAFYAALLTRQVKLVPGQMYETAARKHLKSLSLHSWDKFVIQIQEDGWVAVSRNWVNNAPPNGPVRVATERPNFVSTATMMAVYADFCHTQGLKAASAAMLSSAIKTRMPEVKAARIRLGTNPVRGWEGVPMNAPDADTTPDPTPVETPDDDMPMLEIA